MQKKEVSYINVYHWLAVNLAYPCHSHAIVYHLLIFHDYRFIYMNNDNDHDKIIITRPYVTKLDQLSESEKWDAF